MSATDHRRLAELAADIVTAYTSNNAVRPEDLPATLQSVHQALVQIAFPIRSEPRQKIRRPTTAQILRSITFDGLISFIDGKAYQSLTQHLAKHGLTIEEYQKIYNLPTNYPSICSKLSSTRSDSAFRNGFGRNAQGRILPTPVENRVIAGDEIDGDTFGSAQQDEDREGKSDSAPMSLQYSTPDPKKLYWFI